MKKLGAALALVLATALGATLAHAQAPASGTTPPADTQAPVAAPATATPAASSSPAIENGSKVQLEYTVSETSGTLIETNKGKRPLTYTQGRHQIIPGLEKALVGMHAGEDKKVTVAPEEAYGKPDPKAQIEVPREKVPEGSQKVGAQLTARGSAGALPVRVKEVKDKTVVLDLNHPLAGKTLVFDVHVLQVEPPATGETPAAPKAEPAPSTKPESPAPSAPAK